MDRVLRNEPKKHVSRGSGYDSVVFLFGADGWAIVGHIPAEETERPAIGQGRISAGLRWNDGAGRLTFATRGSIERNVRGIWALERVSDYDFIPLARIRCECIPCGLSYFHNCQRWRVEFALAGGSCIQPFRYA